MGFNQIHFDEQTGRTILCDENFNYIFNLYSEKPTNVKDIVSGSFIIKEKFEIDYEFNNKQDCEYPDFIDNKRKEALLPSIRKIKSYAISPKSPNLNPNDAIRNKLLKILKFYFKSNKINDICPDKIFINPLNGIASPIKSEFSKLDRNFILEKIKKFLDEHHKKKIAKGEKSKNDPFMKAMKKILNFLLMNENILITFHRRITMSPSNFIRKKFNELSEKIKLLKSQEKKRDDDFNNKNKLFCNFKNENNFNYFESICHTSEKNEKNSANFSRDNQENLSFLSIDSNRELNEDEKQYIKYRDSRFKSLKEMKKFQEREDSRNKGYIYPLIKVLPKLQTEKKTLKSNGDFYIKSMELLRKVNPIAFELQKKQEDFDRKIFEKKRKNKIIIQNNMGFKHEFLNKNL